MLCGEMSLKIRMPGGFTESFKKRDFGMTCFSICGSSHRIGMVKLHCIQFFLNLICTKYDGGKIPRKDLEYGGCYLKESPQDSSGGCLTCSIFRMKQ